MNKVASQGHIFEFKDKNKENHIIEEGIHVN
jgi:hypothetical protein